MASAPKTAGSDTQLQGLLDQSLAGNPAAKEALLHHACDRLLKLTRKMFHGHPGLRRWVQTDDVFQNSLVRLHRALSKVEVEDVRHFFNLATVQIRRELLDLARKTFGPHGIGRNHHTDHQAADETGGSLHKLADEPDDLESWESFHQQVDALPDHEREVFGLIYYEGLEQLEAAKVLDISERTVRNRWNRAKLLLSGELNDESGAEEENAG
jgi:RNA polymerase sigma-70 factor (ECF subfamily)